MATRALSDSSRGDEAPLRDLAEAAAEPPAPRQIRKLLDLLRRYLDMDVAFVSEFRAGRQVYREVEGKGAPLGIAAGASVSLDDTFCVRVVQGDLPEVIPNTRMDAVAASVPAGRERDIGAYVGVPLTFSTGEVYGTLCCLSREADPDLAAKEVAFVKVVARLVADQLERQELRSETWRLQVQGAAVQALVRALAARDGYTADHSDEVVELARAVADRMGLSAAQATEVAHAALLHDIGKIGVPDAILRKPGPLDDAEWEVMRRHPETSETIVQSVPGLQHLAPGLRAEHERWDGHGYPDGLRGDEIPLASRIILACDAYHAMVSDRPYRSALPHAVAVDELRRNAGTQFDPAVVDALISVIPPGSPA